MTRNGKHALVGLCFAAPALLIVGVFFAYPLVMTAWMSLHDWPLLGTPNFIGLQNYVEMLGDRRFWSSLNFTLIYTVVTTVAIFVVALPMAIFVDQKRRLIPFYRTAFFLPVVVGLPSASLLWVWLLNVDNGLFTPLAKMVFGLDRPKAILGSFNSAFVAIVIMVVWKVAGFTMIILLTGLQSVSAEVKEAAKMDGAGPFRTFVSITFPLMRKSFSLALILSVAGSMLAFDQFYIMTSGGPRNSMISVVYWIFNQSFIQLKLGYGAALSIALLAILVLVSVVQFMLLREPRASK